MRAFIAIDLPESIRASLGREQAAFRTACSPPRPSGNSHRDGEIRWTRPEAIHLTLKFLGPISGKQVGQITEALAELKSFERFPVEVKGFGFFPDARRPHVFWAGVEGPRALNLLVQQVEAAMETLGFTKDQRSFSPHLTLARFRTPRPHTSLQACIDERREFTLGRFEVSEFFLFESKLSPQGAEYRKIARFPRPSRVAICTD
jgi:RNA 2',3'-cyclic 3'-phosphodiesterase